MPYTPPTKRSPAGSTCASPTLSKDRRPSATGLTSATQPPHSQRVSRQASLPTIEMPSRPPPPPPPPLSTSSADGKFEASSAPSLTTRSNPVSPAPSAQPSMSELRPSAQSSSSLFSPTSSTARRLPHSTTSKSFHLRHRPGDPLQLSRKDGPAVPPAASSHTALDATLPNPQSSAKQGIAPDVQMDNRSLSLARPREATSKVSMATGQDSHCERGRLPTADTQKLVELQAVIRKNIEREHLRSGSPTGLDMSRQSSATRGDPDPGSSRRESRRPAPILAPPFDPHKDCAEDSPDSSSSPLQIPLSATARKISHSRSSTETSALNDHGRDPYELAGQRRSLSISEAEMPPSAPQDDDDPDARDSSFARKPTLVRKKSGELVRPALRTPSFHRRPTSMPGTPTYSKAVHFQDNSLEHVRHFLQVDRPIAVSAGSSPIESHEDEAEFPFGSSGTDGESSPRQYGKAYDWEIRLANFDRAQPRGAAQNSAPVRTEKIYLSTDTRMLLGDVAVRNLAFHKVVVARFTLDFWKTTSEVLAEYNPALANQSDSNYDRFTFSIKLNDQANLENKTMFFCVRYSVSGQEFWDNNGNINYQVDFTKRYRPSKKDTRVVSSNSSLGGGHGNGNGSPRRLSGAVSPTTGLPRSRPYPRPHSMPSFDDFSNPDWSPFDFKSVPAAPKVSEDSFINDTPLRFRNRMASAAPSLSTQSPSTYALTPAIKPGGSSLANLSQNNGTGLEGSSAAGQAFGNRYDFGASLSAAIQAAASTAPSSANQCKSAKEPVFQRMSALPSDRPSTTAETLKSNHGLAQEKLGLMIRPSSQLGVVEDASRSSSKFGNTIKTGSLSFDGSNDTGSAKQLGDLSIGITKPALQSPSYNELLNKYCFFGSIKPGPPIMNAETQIQPVQGRTDGLDDSEVSPRTIITDAKVTVPDAPSTATMSTSSASSSSSSSLSSVSSATSSNSTCTAVPQVMTPPANGRSVVGSTGIDISSFPLPSTSVPPPYHNRHHTSPTPASRPSQHSSHEPLNATNDERLMYHGHRMAHTTTSASRAQSPNTHAAKKLQHPASATTGVSAGYYNSFSRHTGTFLEQCGVAAIRG